MGTIICHGKDPYLPTSKMERESVFSLPKWIAVVFSMDDLNYLMTSKRVTLTVPVAQVAWKPFLEAVASCAGGIGADPDLWDWEDGARKSTPQHIIRPQ